jgi:hypothetical protein
MLCVYTCMWFLLTSDAFRLMVAISKAWCLLQSGDTVQYDWSSSASRVAP